LLYKFLQWPAKIGLQFWCRSLLISNKEVLNTKGPILLAANHPNSFLDAILLCSIFKQPVYSLARGDAFKNEFVAKILQQLYMYPVYRISEGAENVNSNYQTFSSCIQLFKQNKTVLIFSEGLCINEWHLRPLKKGTARLVLSAWQQHIPLTVLPVGINYHSFFSFGKNIQVNFGTPITQPLSLNINTESEGKQIQWFNYLLKEQLQQLVVENKPVDKIKLQKQFLVKQSNVKKAILSLPALFGLLTHAPLYLLVKYGLAKKIKEAGHYDSVLVGGLFIAYPLFLTAAFAILCSIFNVWIALSAMVCLLFCAWSYVQLKKQF
jgi:1-acyl-sn-glycerol-3-phosphate acyltransferase